ncbi:nucleotide sugar dehydrogenase [Chloroflexota bacterium]
MNCNLDKAIVCIVGLGYVGLDLARAFSKRLRVIGFDIDNAKIVQLNQQTCSTIPNESIELLTPATQLQQNLSFTANPKDIGKADFIIITVPTPVTSAKEPDLSCVRSAAKIVGDNMHRDSIVIVESTVYPTVTEEIVKPILERESRLTCGTDFKIAYSPERVNPGDEVHSIDKIVKVVAAMDRETTDLVARLYQKVTPSIFKAKDIRTAEAAKVIENIQRDLNIALMNEIALILDKMNLSTKDVLDAAATKWNFNHYLPGLVGGHCIPVDPYYLVSKAKELGYYPQVILAGRAINEYMPKHVAQLAIRALNEVGKIIKSSKTLIMGLTYKENVADIRESPVKGIIEELKGYGTEIIGFDPLLSPHEFEGKFNINLLRTLEEAEKVKVDCIIIAVAHLSFHNLTLSRLKELQNDNPILIDVRRIFDAEKAKDVGFLYKSL